MKGDKVVVGVFFIIMGILLGSAVGILGGYYLGGRTSAESLQTVAEEVSMGDSVEESQEDPSGDAVSGLSEEVVIKEPFSIGKVNTVEGFLETWSALMEKTCIGDITQQEASRLIYQLASEGYRRNIPEEYGALRIKGIWDKSLGSFEAIQFAEPIFDGEGIVLIDVTEIYVSGSNSYRLKLIKENNQWYFAAQFRQ